MRWIQWLAAGDEEDGRWQGRALEDPSAMAQLVLACARNGHPPVLGWASLVWARIQNGRNIWAVREKIEPTKKRDYLFSFFLLLRIFSFVSLHAYGRLLSALNNLFADCR